MRPSGENMDKQWFVLHTLTGKEARVRDTILHRAKQEELGEYIGDVSIPTEKVTEDKKGKKSKSSQQKPEEFTGKNNL